MHFRARQLMQTPNPILYMQWPVHKVNSHKANMEWQEISKEELTEQPAHQPAMHPQFFLLFFPRARLAKQFRYRPALLGRAARL